MDREVIDHRGPGFATLAREVLDGMRGIFQTSGPVVVFPASGTGGCEAALVNTLSPGDRVLIFETGWFSYIAWRQAAEKLGLEVDYVPGNWRRGVSPSDVEDRLTADARHAIKAVVVVHNETSTGVTSRIGEIRRALNRTGHPALLIVDTISSLASIDYRHDEWQVDVSVGCSQKGLMVPPGLGFNAVSEKAIAAYERATLPRSYFDWQEMFRSNAAGFFPYTPATNLLYGLREARVMLREEGLPNVFGRHDRHAEATRAAVRAWGLEILCEEPLEYSSSLTAVVLPDGRVRVTLALRNLTSADPTPARMPAHPIGSAAPDMAKAAIAGLIIAAAAVTAFLWLVHAAAALLLTGGVITAVATLGTLVGPTIAHHCPGCRH
jgi:alanine-glyoxylate transaminase/serine-glyoxylate transaminase/serine-pyruvate transaminase